MNQEIVVCGIPFGSSNVKDILKRVKDTGFTSVQIYTAWRQFEPNRRGEFNWDFYDRQVALIKEAGLKYVPFILLGPRYAAPDWWLADPCHKGLTCLEHQKVSPIESIWNENFRKEIDRVLEAFAAHYLPWDVLESIQPGICGDYGEAIFPVTGNWPGAYHTHRGFWCGGEDAVLSFRQSLMKKYGSIDELNRNWSSHYKSFDEIKPFLRHKAPSRTAYMDLLLWYHASMTDYAEFWMERCRAHFPDTPVYLCTGGIEEPEHGSSFADQASIAAKHGGGIRLTNEGNNFYDNYYLTIHMHSACKFYGAYLGLEPVGPMIPKGVTARMYGSAAYGNRQIFHYYTNLFSGEQPGPGAERVKKYRHLIREHTNQNRIAFFWPKDEAMLNGSSIPENIKLALTFIRKQYDVDVVSEPMIEDGALERYTLLVMLDTDFTRGSVLEKISEWVKSGGTILSNRRTTDIEGQPVGCFDRVFGIVEDSEEVWGHCEYFCCSREWAERLNSVQQVHSMFAWNKLNKTVIPLLKNNPPKGRHFVGTQEAYCAFENPYGEGRGIFYAGPMDLDAKEDALWKPSKAFAYLLEDCCREFGDTQPLGLEEGEIARTRLADAMLILKEDSIEEKVLSTQ